MSDTPETDAASQNWLRIRTNGETFIDENKIVLADKMEAMERQRNDALQLARELREVIELIQNSSFSAPESKEEAEAAERAQAIIDAALTRANQLLK